MEGQFREANEKYTNIFRRVARKAYLAHPVSEFLSTIVLMIVLYYGGMLALNGTGSMTSDKLIGVCGYLFADHPAGKSLSQRVVQHTEGYGFH